MGHLGGFISGTFISLILAPTIGRKNKWIERLGYLLSLIFYVGGIALFFTVRHP